MIAFRQDFDNGFAQNVRGMFGKGDLLSGAKNFEYRPEQQQMAEAVADAFEGNRHLVVEAGTGVGKTLAYLGSGRALRF